ncbi:hypothetical protein [Clostridium sp.]|uniref:hypothetical protein n=1 Tax=Clostridium sp. TaxID=1506 RepID=UPI00285156E8|nr:hypothetical protein [Clostridium sp.]MDR3598421.1 hypothetical protein [Clostridium sp.]
MEINDLVTELDLATRIIKEVGELHQTKVLEKLKNEWWELLEDTEEERKAKRVIFNIYTEYALNTANVLWKDKFQEIPQYLKEW